MKESAEPVITVVKSELDGCWVVQIESDPEIDGEPLMRIYLNEASLHENPEFPTKAYKHDTLKIVKGDA